MKKNTLFRAFFCILFLIAAFAFFFFLNKEACHKRYSNPHVPQVSRVEKIEAKQSDEASYPKTDYSALNGAYRNERDLVSWHTFASLPKSPEKLEVLANQAYVSGYSDRLGEPLWVEYRVFENNGGRSGPRPERFSSDGRVKMPVYPEVYRYSGFDRGHMCPNYAAFILYGPRAQMETFLMSNVIPQSASLNRGWWSKLESAIIHIAANKLKNAWVTVGPIIQINKQTQFLVARVPVPTGCYAIIAYGDESSPHYISFVAGQGTNPNDTLGQHVTSVRQIEQMTSLNFFSSIPQEISDTAENEVADVSWMENESKYIEQGSF